MKQNRPEKKPRRTHEPPALVLGVAWYRPEQWDRLLALSEDRDELEKTHGEWLKGALRAMGQLEAQGIIAESVSVDVDELAAWCAARNTSINAESRSAFAAEKVRLRHEGGQE